MIEVKNVTQTYGRDIDVLKDISFSVPSKKVTALVGANGAGKSTLLGVIANLIPARCGQVLLNGEDIRKISIDETAKKIAFLKQSQQLSIRIPVKDLVEFGRFPHCKGKLKDDDNKKVAQAIDYMDLSDFSHKYLDEISGGQRQRAFIAMILAQDTPYIFLDEPLNNLDIKYSVEMMKIVKKLVAELGKSIVVVLHDINFASAYADHIIAMKDGMIHGQGSPSEVIKPDVLNPVFSYDFNIMERDGKKVCLYFN